MSQFRRFVAVMATLASRSWPFPPRRPQHQPTPRRSDRGRRPDARRQGEEGRQALKRYVARSATASTVAKQLKIARSQTARRSQRARRMAKHGRRRDAASHHGRAGADARRHAVRRAARDAHRARRPVTGTVQALIASAIRRRLAGKQQIIDDPRPDRCSTRSRRRRSRSSPSIIAALGAGDATEVVNLDNALNIGTLPATITGHRQRSASAMATARDRERVRHDPGLPPDAAGRRPGPDRHRS